MSKPRIELLIDDENGSQQVAYPFVNAKHVLTTNGMSVGEMLDGDISMPSVTHDTTAIKVGVGDSDVSGSVVDGTVNMTIKGQTYQNILPDPTLRNEMQGKSMQRLNEGYDNIEVVDGVSKSAILKGQTLVNLFEHFKFGCNHDANTGIYTSTQDEWVEPVKTTQNVKTNVTYTLFAKVNTTSDQLYIRLDYNSGNVAKDRVVFGEVTPNNDINIKTTVQFGVEDKIRFVLRNAHGGIVKMSEIMLVEGDYTNQDIPYFTGMTSCKMPVLTTTGKNLCKYRNGFSSNGLTFTNTDSGVTVDGTASTIVDYYITTRTGLINVETLDILNSLQVGTRVFLSNNLGKSSFISYTLNGETKFADNVTIQNGMQIIGAFIRFREGDICNNLNLTIQLEIGNEVTSYEPHKSNILRTPEEVILKGLGDVQDTLNVNTGEYVERVGEVIFDGSDDEVWTRNTTLSNGFETSYFTYSLNNSLRGGGGEITKISDWLPSLGDRNHEVDKEGITCVNEGEFSVRILKTKLESDDVAGFKKLLSSKNLHCQFLVKTPIIKTVDLSSHGNWEKVILDGSDSITYGANWNDIGTAYYTNLHFDHPHVFSDRMTKTGGWTITEPDHSFALRENNKKYQLVLVVHNQHTNGGNNVQGLKQYLSQNPITFWYQTTTTQDNSIREMLSFANGHLQVSSEAENSLLPSVQYEIPTKNSYHMDLMKTNTLYTMKAKSVSGTFTIDGTSYNVNTNGTFTSPSSMTDKLLIMSNKTNEEVMLLEGNVIDKTIPYFKGIKSAFEGEDKIEVLSNSGNLANYLESSFAGGSNLESTNANNELTLIDNTNIPYSFIRTPIYKDFVFKKGRKYHVEFEYVITNVRYGQVKIVTPNVAQITNSINFPISNNWSKFKTTLTPILDFSVNSLKHTERGVETCLEFMAFGGEELSGDKTLKIRNVILSEDDIDYKPYKQNVSKIPLLSPLRSLPNGVCDEIILDRENNKAKIIQRVGKVILDGSENWGYTPDWVKGETIGFYLLNDKSNGFCLSDKFIFYHGINSVDHECVSFPKNAWLGVRIKVDKLGTQDVDGFKQYLQQNPLTVYYDLATPIVTEIDLEGYPYVYKDGHIFLNSEVAPTTEIIYSINQAQQIESANENLQRHEKEISHLQKLIAQYIQVEYESTLLSLKI